MAITTPINTRYGDKLACNKLNPCNITCYDYHEKTNDEGPDCNYNMIIYIITIIIFIICTIFIVCNFLKYCIGYICFNCIKPNKSTPKHTTLQAANV